jgi:hypothetical protein
MNKNSIKFHPYRFGDNFIINESNHKDKDNYENDFDYDKPSSSNKKIVSSKPKLYDADNSKTPTIKSSRNSNIESNLDKFKNIENLEKLSKFSSKKKPSKNNSISIRSKISNILTENRYYNDNDNQDIDIKEFDIAKNLDSINDIDKSEKSKFKFSERGKNRSKNRNRIKSKDMNINSLSNDGLNNSHNENIGRFIITKDKQYSEENNKNRDIDDKENKEHFD